MNTKIEIWRLNGVLQKARLRDLELDDLYPEIMQGTGYVVREAGHFALVSVINDDWDQ